MDWLSADDSEELRRTAVVRAIERAKPSVVSIHAVHREAVYYHSPYRDPFFNFFAPPFLGERKRVTAGSGFIVDADGYILTNDHVVGKRPIHIFVNLDDGREFEAVDIGRDYFVDLAVLKVDATDLPVAPLLNWAIFWWASKPSPLAIPSTWVPPPAPGSSVPLTGISKRRRANITTVT